MSIKVFCSGAESYINQINRIRQGFIENNCDLVDLENADLVYCNDPNSFVLNVKEVNPKAKTIFCVLDLPPHLIGPTKYDISRYTFINHPHKRDFNPQNLRNKLVLADKVVCICDEVKWQLKEWCGIDAVTIYNPIKDVSFLNLSDNEKIKNSKGQNYKYLYVGRANDINKRFNLVYETMKILNEPPELLAVVGSENPGWGEYYSIVNDYQLNRFYNSVDYLFFPSAFKSVGLPALEAVVTRTIPIVCNDDPAGKEFFDGIEVPNNPAGIANCLVSKGWNEKAKSFVNNKSEEYKQKFDKKKIAGNIIEVFNSL